MRLLAILILGFLWAAPPAWSQSDTEPAESTELAVADELDEPSADEEAQEEDGVNEEGEEEEEEEEPTADLVFTADSACYVYVDGALEGELEPGESLEVGVVHGTLDLSATSVEVSAARWQETVEIEEGEELTVELPILEAIADLRKTERRTLVWRDTKQGRMWTRRDNARDTTWSDAVTYCEELELGGFENWELPTAEELESIEAMWSLRPFKTQDAFMLTACCAWSSTEATAGTAWNLDFRFRRRFEVNRNLAFGFRALCARDMPPDELADAILIADPKEQKRRLKEKRKRIDERRKRKEERRKARENPPDGI